jgi:hypothetical protein
MQGIARRCASLGLRLPVESHGSWSLTRSCLASGSIRLPSWSYAALLTGIVKGYGDSTPLCLAVVNASKTVRRKAPMATKVTPGRPDPRTGGRGRAPQGLSLAGRSLAQGTKVSIKVRNRRTEPPRQYHLWLGGEAGTDNDPEHGVVPRIQGCSASVDRAKHQRERFLVVIVPGSS